MILASREILHGGAEAFFGESADIDLQAFTADFGTGFVFAVSQHFVHFRICEEALEGRSGIGSGYQEVKIAYRFTAAAEAACRCYRLDTRNFAEEPDQFLRNRLGITQQVASGALAVLANGTRIRLDFTGNDGTTYGIVLPFDSLSGLLMTLPRMLQTALDARFPDSSLRCVQQLSTWQIEQAEGEPWLILRLGTRDGFEVAFSLKGKDADSLGTALLAAPDDIDQSKTRRTH